MTVYVVFHGNEHYPEGGWRDYLSTHATLKEAMDAGALPVNGGWSHIVELADGKALGIWIWSHGEAWTRRPQGWYKREETTCPAS